eukprot:gene11843-12390_t
MLTHLQLGASAPVTTQFWIRSKHTYHQTMGAILASIEIYDVSTNKWSYLNEPIPAAASPRYGHESVYYDGAIYIMGGCTTVTAAAVPPSPPPQQVCNGNCPACCPHGAT